MHGQVGFGLKQPRDGASVRASGLSYMKFCVAVSALGYEILL